MSLKFLPILIILFLNYSCKKNIKIETNTKEFYQAEKVDEKKSIHFKLEQIESSPFKNLIKYESFIIEYYRYSKKDDSPGDRITHVETIHIEFKNLNKEQFNFLINLYSKGTSKVQYDPEQKDSYTLMDFLPPAIQALSNKQWYAIQDKESTNCWSTVYELLTFPTDSYEIYLSSPIEIVEILENQGFSKRIPDDAPLEPGDVILDWWEKNDFISPNIGHAVIYIDKDLYFEKQGLGNTAFVLTSGNYPAANTSKAMQKEDFYYYRALKTFPKAQTRLSKPSKLWVPQKGASIQVISYNINYDDNGRAYFDPEVVFKESTGHNREYLIAKYIPKPQKDLEIFENMIKNNPRSMNGLTNKINSIIYNAKREMKINLLCQSIRYWTEESEKKINFYVSGICSVESGRMISQKFVDDLIVNDMGSTTGNLKNGIFEFSTRYDEYKE